MRRKDGAVLTWLARANSWIRYTRREDVPGSIDPSHGFLMVSEPVAGGEGHIADL